MMSLIGYILGDLLDPIHAVFSILPGVCLPRKPKIFIMANIVLIIFFLILRIILRSLLSSSLSGLPFLAIVLTPTFYLWSCYCIRQAIQVYKEGNIEKIKEKNNIWIDQSNINYNNNKIQKNFISVKEIIPITENSGQNKMQDHYFQELEKLENTFHKNMIEEGCQAVMIVSCNGESRKGVIHNENIFNYTTGDCLQIEVDKQTSIINLLDNKHEHLGTLLEIDADKIFYSSYIGKYSCIIKSLSKELCQVDIYPNLNNGDPLYKEEYYNNGFMKLKYGVSHNLLHGRFVSWHDNGSHEIMGNYNMNRKQGIFEYWDRDGNIVCSHTYKNGVKI